MADQALLNLWTIYESPSDFPGQFVARRHEVRATGSTPTGEFFLTGTLREARLGLPPGLVCLSREPDDDPCIVETWI